MKDNISPEGLSKMLFPTLDYEFLRAMDEIGQHGFAKYGEDSFEARARRGDHSRGTLLRNAPSNNIAHGQDHGAMYLCGVRHDHFGTLGHQLAAMGFNAMMEYYYSKSDRRKAEAETDRILREASNEPNTGTTEPTP